MKLLMNFLIAVAFMQGGCALARSSIDNNRMESARPLSKMSAAQKKQQQQYFTSHSFEFSTIFKRYHPGPYWILEKTRQLQLSNAQIKQQEQLKFVMAKSTISANSVLQQAYAKYASDAKAENPSLAIIEQDIEAVGNAQTHLARVMVPYHLDAYKILNPAQQAVYRKLAAEHE